MLKVLLADDEPLIIRGLRKIIPWENYGLEIIGAAIDGVDLVKTAEEKIPDIIISDICMPRLSGLDAIQHIRKLNLPIKFIFISAHSDPALIKSAKVYGAEHYLIKPIKKVELEQAISNTLKILEESS